MQGTAQKKNEQKFCTIKSRCPCLKAKQQCLTCQCFNCDNGKPLQHNNSLVSVGKFKASKKRDHAGKLVRITAEQFMHKENIALRGKRWNIQEEFLLLEIITKHGCPPKTRIEIIVNDFNATIVNNSDMGSTKTRLQILRKLSAWVKN